MEILTESYPINTNLLKKLSDALYSITDVNKFLDVINKLTLDTLNIPTVDIQIFSPGDRSSTLHENVRIDESHLCIPLVSQDNLVGTLVFKPEKQLSSTNLKFISEFADLLAASINIALNMQRQIKTLDIQQYFVSSIRTGVISINSEKIIVSFNKYAENILGLKAEEVCNKSIDVLPKEIRNTLLLALEKGIIRDKEDLYLFSHNIPINISTSRILDNNNIILGAVILFTDLRDRYNSGYFKEILRDELRRSKRYGHQFCIVFINLQELDKKTQRILPTYNMESINKIATHINKTIRECDRIIKYSINEIAILLPETQLNGGLRFIQRLEKGLQTQRLTEKIIASIGIACCPVDGTTSEDLIHKAVTSLYNAMRSIPNAIKNSVSVR